MCTKKRGGGVRDCTWLWHNFYYNKKNQRLYQDASEGSVSEYLSQMQTRKPTTSHIFMSILFHKRKIIYK